MVADHGAEGARALAACFALHRALALEGKKVSRVLMGRADEEDHSVGIGASCIQIAAEQALAARHEVEAIRAWTQCELGERQVRRGTCLGLRDGHLSVAQYDALFAIAAKATRARREEIVRLRRILRRATLL